MYDKSFLFSCHTDTKGIQKLRPYQRRLTKSLRKIILKCVLIKINLLNLMSYVKVRRGTGLKITKKKFKTIFHTLVFLKFPPTVFFVVPFLLLAYLSKSRFHTQNKKTTTTNIPFASQSLNVQLTLFMALHIFHFTISALVVVLTWDDSDSLQTQPREKLACDT